MSFTLPEPRNAYS